MFNICNYIRKRNKPEIQYEYILDAYKNELNIQNMYTINDYIENVRILHDEVKKAGYSVLLQEIEEFQNTITHKTKELLTFHREIR
jgi:hypothetical protein